MICEECKSCPIKVLCDKTDSIIDENLSLDGEHDILMAIYEKGRQDAIDEAIAYFEIHAHEVYNHISARDFICDRLEQIKESKE